MNGAFIETDPQKALCDLFSLLYPEEKAGTIARKLLDTYGSLSRILLIHESVLEADIGREAALFLRLSISLSLRRKTDKLRPGDTVTEAVLAKHFLSLYADVGQECVYLMLLDKEDKLLSLSRIAVGAADASALVPRQVLELSLRAGASAVIVAHNHPGGTPTSSASDQKQTAAIAAALSTAHIRFLGHYIFADHTFCRVNDGDTTSVQQKFITQR